jgi:hypothetical protein
MERGGSGRSMCEPCRYNETERVKLVKVSVKRQGQEDAPVKRFQVKQGHIFGM